MYEYKISLKKKPFVHSSISAFKFHAFVYNKVVEHNRACAKGVSRMTPDLGGTTRFMPIVEGKNNAADILEYVYRALQAKGLRPGDANRRILDFRRSHLHYQPSIPLAA